MYQGVNYRRSSGTGNIKAACRLQLKIEDRLEQIQTQLIEVPDGVTLRDFLLFGKTKPTVAAVKVPTVGEVIDEYQKTVGPPKIRESSAKAIITHLNHMRRFLRKKKDALPSSIEHWHQRDVDAYRRWRLSKSGVQRGYRIPRPCTVKREVRTWSQVFSFAIQQEWIDANPADRLPEIPDNGPDDNFQPHKIALKISEAGGLTREEEKAVLRYQVYDVGEVDEIIALMDSKADSCFVKTPGDLALAIYICAKTGMRIGEVLRLKKKDLHLDASTGTGEVVARSKKQSRSKVETVRYIPLAPDAVQRISHWVNKTKGDLLFGSDGPEKRFMDKLYRQLDRATKGTEFFALRPHQLRHTFKTNAFEAGIDDKVISEMLGHTTQAMADRYRHLRRDYIREQMQQKVWNRPKN